MPRFSAGILNVTVSRDGALVLRGELDIEPVQDLQDVIDEMMVPGRAIILDMALLTFMDSSAIDLFIKTYPDDGPSSRAAERITLFAASWGWSIPGQSPEVECSTDPGP